MTFIEKVKESVELTTGCRFYYHAAGELNEVLAGVEIGSEPISFAYLLKGGEVAVGKNCREGVNLAVFFCKKTEFDFNSYENEQLIDECKQLAFGWVSWFSKSNTLEIVGNVTTERVYDTTTDILTGIAVNITLRELVGYGMCDIKKPVLIIEKNGVYTFGAYDVKVEVIPKSGELVAKENGTYLPSEYGVDAFNKVDVDIDPLSQCGYAVFDTNEYNGGILNINKIKKINVSCLVTAQTTSLSNAFYGFKSLKEIIGLKNWDTSKVTNMESVFHDCKYLQSLDVSGWDVSNVTTLKVMFYNCRSLTSLDLNNWNTSKVQIINGIFRDMQKLKILNISNWDTSSVTDISYMFCGTRILKRVDLSGWDASNVTNTNYMFYETSLYSIIGDKTLQDVENGTVALRGLKVNISTQQCKLIFSSILALANGLEDLTGSTAQTLTISSQSYNNMYNDDNTLPASDVIAECKARIAAICAAKNWNFAH